MIEISRRGFLGSMFAAAAASVPALASPAVVRVQSLMALAPRRMILPVREVCAYDIRTDSLFVRHDILFVDSTGRKTQFQVHLQARDMRSFELGQTHREIADELIVDAMRRHGFTYADVRPLPLPASRSATASRLRNLS